MSEIEFSGVEGVPHDDPMLRKGRMLGLHAAIYTLTQLLRLHLYREYGPTSYVAIGGEGKPKITIDWREGVSFPFSRAAVLSVSRAASDF